MNYDKWHKLEYDSSEDEGNDSNKKNASTKSFKGAEKIKDFNSKMNWNKNKGPVSADEVLKFAQDAGISFLYSPTLSFFDYEMPDVGIGPGDILETMKNLNIDMKGLFTGGVFDDNETARSAYSKMAIMSNKLTSKKEYGLTQNVPDSVSAGFISKKSINELNEVKSVRKLQAGIINQGVFICTTVVESVCRLVGINTLVEDSLGQLFLLALYNFVRDQSTNAECRKHIPVGSRIVVKEPYLKCFQSGKLGLRVDHPSNVEIKVPHQTGFNATNNKNNSNLDRYVRVCMYGSVHVHFNNLKFD